MQQDPSPAGDAIAKEVDPEMLAMTILKNVGDEYEQSQDIDAARERLHREREAMAVMLSPEGAADLDRYLLDLLVEYFVMD